MGRRSRDENDLQYQLVWTGQCGLSYALEMLPDLRLGTQFGWPVTARVAPLLGRVSLCIFMEAIASP